MLMSETYKSVFLNQLGIHCPRQDAEVHRHKDTNQPICVYDTRSRYLLAPVQHVEVATPMFDADESSNERL